MVSVSKHVGHTECVIIGSGLSGLCMAINLMQQDVSFLVLEKADDLGGTWKENTYPGARCDIPQSLYSFSFEPAAGSYTNQPEMYTYQRYVADKYKVAPYMRYKQEVVKAVYDDATSQWTVYTASGGEYFCQFLIPCAGQLHIPTIPNFQGRDCFKGPSFHTAQWDHSVSHTNKRIGIIGSAASAIQVVPEVAKVASQVEIFQRSPNYIMPYMFGYPWQMYIAQSAAWINLLFRRLLFLLSETVFFGSIRGHWLWQPLFEWVCLSHMKFWILDLELRKKLTPSFPIGAKRTLFVESLLSCVES